MTDTLSFQLIHQQFVLPITKYIANQISSWLKAHNDTAQTPWTRHWGCEALSGLPSILRIVEIKIYQYIIKIPKKMLKTFVFSNAFGW